MGIHRESFQSLKVQSIHVENIPMVILDGYPWGLKMISGVIPVSENGMSATGYIILSYKKNKVVIKKLFSTTIVEFALSTNIFIPYLLCTLNIQIDMQNLVIFWGGVWFVS